MSTTALSHQNVGEYPNLYNILSCAYFPPYHIHRATFFKLVVRYLLVRGGVHAPGGHFWLIHVKDRFYFIDFVF